MMVKDQGGDASWKQFASLYHGYIYALVRKYKVSHEDAEELVQDVLVKVWKALGSFLYEPERCRFRTWLSRICKNTAINFVKLKSSRNKSQHVDDGEELILKLSSGSEIHDKEEVEWQVFIAEKAWQEARQKFSSLHLDVYVAMAEGDSATVVAERLEIKENTAYVYRKAVQEGMNQIIKRLNAELDA